MASVATRPSPKTLRLFARGCSATTSAGKASGSWCCNARGACRFVLRAWASVVGCVCVCVCARAHNQGNQRTIASTSQVFARMCHPTTTSRCTKPACVACALQTPVKTQPTYTLAWCSCRPALPCSALPCSVVPCGRCSTLLFPNHAGGGELLLARGTPVPVPKVAAQLQAPCRPVVVRLSPAWRPLVRGATRLP